MAAKRLRERFSFEGGKVGGTTEAPVLESVLLCGAVSANRRRYLAGAFAGDRVQRYNGAPVNLNHGTGPDGRPYQEQIGIVQNARLRADGMPIGDIAVNPKKPYAEAFLWDAKHQPKACGMSHVAHCETAVAKDGWDEVTELVRVESVDVIAAGNAATTKGLYESTHMKISLKQFVEQIGPKWGPAKWGAAKKLCEDMGAPADAPVMDAPADGAAEGDLKTGLMAALAPILDDAFESGNSDKAVSALKDFIKLHAKHTGKEPPSGSESGGDDAAAKEAKARAARPDPWTVLAEARTEFGPDYSPGPAELEALAGLPTPAARKAFLAEQKARAKPAQDPKSGGRYKPLSESAGGAQAPAADAKTFLDRVMG